jgi:hypothetical protein
LSIGLKPSRAFAHRIDCGGIEFPQVAHRIHPQKSPRRPSTPVAASPGDLYIVNKIANQRTFVAGGGGSMSLDHRPLMIAGERVGDVVSIGERVVLYTTHPSLLHLDGKRFGSFDLAAAVALAALERAREAIVPRRLPDAGEAAEPAVPRPH